MNSERDTVFKGRIISVTVENVVLPNGAQLAMEIVHHPGGATVVALDNRERVCLLRQYRHAVGGWIWELPAGKIDNQEPPLETARRELAEEAGVQADKWRALGEMISSPGVFDERIWLFLASELQPVDSVPEEHEVFEQHWLPWSKALRWAHDGTLNDAKSVVALLRAASLLGG